MDNFLPSNTHARLLAKYAEMDENRYKFGRQRRQAVMIFLQKKITDLDFPFYITPRDREEMGITDKHECAEYIVSILSEWNNQDGRSKVEYVFGFLEHNRLIFTVEIKDK